jgi:hypothetical protein
MHAPPENPAPTTEESAHPHEHDETQFEFEEHYITGSFVPRGTLLFLLVMLLGYALYWAYLWFIVVIERGPGGPGGF